MALHCNSIGVSADGTEMMLMAGMTLEAATEAQADPEISGDYENLRIEAEVGRDGRPQQ